MFRLQKLQKVVLAKGLIPTSNFLRSQWLFLAPLSSNFFQSPNKLSISGSIVRNFSTENKRVESSVLLRKTVEYAVIGGGPAGILALGKILDKIGPKKFYDEVVWYDPKFKVGMFGEKWYNVPSNTTT